ncbi:hypothetical protein GQ457_05G025490 [Hibiscus cannabinus]
MSMFILTSYRERMKEISSSTTLFPHRSGYLYEIQYIITWEVAEETRKYVGWMRRVYKYMECNVSTTSRAAYFNYMDLDLGRNSFPHASLLFKQICFHLFSSSNQVANVSFRDPFKASPRGDDGMWVVRQREGASFVAGNTAVTGGSGRIWDDLGFGDYFENI